MALAGVVHVEIVAHEVAHILAVVHKLIRRHFAEPGHVGEFERSKTTEIATVLLNHSWGDDLTHGARVELMDLILPSSINTGLESILL